MKTVLVISSSLRANSNSEALADAFARGAADAGNRVEKVTLKEKDIRFCKGCLACLRTQRCAIADDAPAIAERMREADAIAFSTPIRSTRPTTGSATYTCSRRPPKTPRRRPSAPWQVLRAGSTASPRLVSRAPSSPEASTMRAISRGTTHSGSHTRPATP